MRGGTECGMFRFGGRRWREVWRPGWNIHKSVPAVWPSLALLAEYSRFGVGPLFGKIRMALVKPTATAG